MNGLLYSVWDARPPRVHAISYPIPGTPHLTLVGGSVTDMSVDKYVKDLEQEVRNQSGAYFAYVWGCHNSQDEADIYTLQTWQICRPDDGTYEAVVLLYYAAMNPYLTIKKHFGEAEAEEYLARNAAVNAIADAFAEI